MAEAFQNSPGALCALGPLCPPCPVYGLCCRGMFHCTMFSPYARRHLVVFITCSTPHFPFTNTCGAEEFICELQSSRNRVQKSLAQEKKGQREKRDQDALEMVLCNLWCQFCIAARAFHSQQSNTPKQQDTWKVSPK